ncbi:L,D-transpeptidase [Verrucomicrobiales bacterium]|nr:L,D-transpeptidase [Verrucomicrobiales bacterium]
MMQTAEIYSAEVSIEKQLLRLYSSNNYCKEYRVSTSRFGIGHELNSFKTPTGKFEIEQKIGAGEPLGTVFNGRRTAGVYNFKNQVKDDLILTRILWLSGLENHNKNTFDRYIYIHGTNHVNELGKPHSMGCIRMSNEDIIEVYNFLGLGSKVFIYD